MSKKRKENRKHLALRNRKSVFELHVCSVCSPTPTCVSNVLVCAQTTGMYEADDLWCVRCCCCCCCKSDSTPLHVLPCPCAGALCSLHSAFSRAATNGGLLSAAYPGRCWRSCRLWESTRKTRILHLFFIFYIFFSFGTHGPVLAMWTYRYPKWGVICCHWRTPFSHSHLWISFLFNI